MYYGITGGLRWLKEHYTQEQIEKIANSGNEKTSDYYYKSLLLMSVFFVGSIVAIGAWDIMKYLLGDFNKFLGVVIRFIMAIGFSKIIWVIINRKK